MVSNAHVRVYRPQNQIAAKGRGKGGGGARFSLSPEVRRSLMLLVAVALLAGLAVTQFFYGRMMELRADAERLRVVNTSLQDEHARLLSLRTQLASKSHVIALAGVKLDLHEPGRAQIRRM